MWKRREMSERRRWIFLVVSAIVASAVVFYVVLKHPAEEFQTATEKIANDMMQTPGNSSRTLGFKPCEVYFTDNMKTCDDNDFKYNRTYYETKLKKVQAAVKARGGAPTPAQNEQILRYTRILDDYKNLPQTQYCKLSLPNWKVRVDETDAPFISNNKHNSDRGSPDSWAFCWRANSSSTILDEGGMIVDKTGGKLQGKDFDGAFHVRGTFDETISRERVIKTYCAETKESVKPYVIQSAIVVEDAPGAARILFYKNNQAANLSEADVNKYFRDQLFQVGATIKTQGSARTGYVTAVPQLRSLKLVKMAFDPCNKPVEHYNTMASVKFNSSITLSTTQLGQGNDYLYGLIPVLEQRISDRNTTIVNVRLILVTLRSELANLNNQLANKNNEKITAVNGYNNALNELNACKNRKKVREGEIQVANDNIKAYQVAEAASIAAHAVRIQKIKDDKKVRIANSNKAYDNAIKNAEDSKRCWQVPTRQRDCRKVLWWVQCGNVYYTYHTECNHAYWNDVKARLAEYKPKAAANIENEPLPARIPEIRPPNPPPEIDCTNYENAFNTATAYVNSVQAQIDKLINDIRNKNNQINQREEEVRKNENEVRLLYIRISEMKDNLRNGILGMMNQRKVTITIPNETTEQYAFLSYNQNYVIEI